MFDKSIGIIFKAQIRPGAAIGQDFGYFRWPDAAHPQKLPADFSPEMEFDVEFNGQFFNLRRTGYGEKPHYGNGSIFVHKLDELVVVDADRKRVIDYLSAEKQKEIDKASAELLKLHAEKAALLLPSRNRGCDHG